MTAPLDRPIVIAHRGASGYRPEHTLAAYDLAIAMGADFIEPDLVSTSDGVLVARHENEIGETTDVSRHPAFAERRTTKTIDGRQVTGWFTENFTLAELKTLRAIERLPLLRPDNKAYDGQFEVPTLAEIVALAKRRTAELGRTIGIYPETKHPTYFRGINLPLEERLAAELRAAGWHRPDDPVFLQSFEVNNLRHLATLTDLRRIQLVDASGGPADAAAPSYAAMLTPAGLAEIARYAHGIGPNKSLVQDGDHPPTTLVADAHAVGLRVHPWTFRAENFFLPSSLRRGINPRGHGDVAAEMARQLAQGIDGFFTDFADIGVQARDAAVRDHHHA